MSYFPKSKTEKWGTPPDFYKTLNDEFHFDEFDPCPIDWKQGDPDGLSVEWANRQFINPPYSNVAKWIEKATIENQKGKLVVLLINAKTNTIAFHKFIYQKPNVEVRFIKGRLCFVNPNEPEKRQQNPVGSMVIIFKP